MWCGKSVVYKFPVLKPIPLPDFAINFAVKLGDIGGEHKYVKCFRDRSKWDDEELVRPAKEAKSKHFGMS